jgi:hypothetical protein
VVKKLIRGNVLKEEAPWVNLDVDGKIVFGRKL